MPTRRATAVWEGGLRSGKWRSNGENGESGAAYSFGSRFEDVRGSNLEELLAAAEAACYSMALGTALEQRGTPATRRETQAGCTIIEAGDGFRVTTMSLAIRANVPNIEDPDVQRIAETTKQTCPVPKTLGGKLSGSSMPSSLDRRGAEALTTLPTKRLSDARTPARAPTRLGVSVQ